MMVPEIREQLEMEESPLHRRVLSYFRPRIRAAEDHMSQRYPVFNEMEHLYRSFRDPDQNDLEVSSNAMTLGTRKIVVPAAYYTLQSLLAWQMQFFTERKPVIPVEGLGPRDVKPAMLHEHLLEANLDGMQPKGILAFLQWFLDSYRYGVGVVANAWVVREYLGLTRQPAPVTFGGQAIGQEDQLVQESTVAYEGNQLINVSPFNFLPDPRLPLGRFQEGDFCGYRQERGMMDLKVKRRAGLYAGIKWIPATRQDALQSQSRGRDWSGSELGASLGLDVDTVGYIDENGKPLVVLHHLYALIPPNVLQLDDPQEDVDGIPKLWKATIANQARVIQLEEANLPSREFPFAVIEPNFDLHSPMNPGVLETIAGPAYHLSWLVNSRVANVRRSLNYEVVYDPSFINEEDLKNPNAAGLIRLSTEAQHTDVPMDRIIKQMPVTDVTSSHMSDAQMWSSMIEQISGANRMIQGLSNTGRRAATEVQSQMSLAAGRMKLSALIFATQGVSAWALQAIKHNQAYLSERLTVRVLDPYREVLGQDYLDITPELLSGSFRVPLMEQGIPTDKVFHTNAVKELLEMCMRDPNQAQNILSKVNGIEIYLQYLRLMGIRDLKNYVVPPPPPQAGTPGFAPQMAQVMPDEQVQRQVEAGNLIPNDMPTGGNMGTPGIGTMSGMLG